MITVAELEQMAGITHGFFTREGGHSRGLYASLNTGLGADEDTEITLKNRQIVADRLGAISLVTPYQYHSAVALEVTKPWNWQDPPKADALVTRQKGIAIAVNTADCTPILFADDKAGVIGVAHSGWQGTISGVLEATVKAMQDLGARSQDIVAAIGPTISQKNYEVGPEFVARFNQADPANAAYFSPSTRPDHAMFDLPKMVADKLAQLDLGAVIDTGLCTYENEDRFFSYRRTTHRKEPDYGRQMSAICLI